MDDPAALEAVEPAEVRDSPRQLPVASLSLPEDEAVPRAVHRLLHDGLEIRRLAVAEQIQRLRGRRKVHVLAVARQMAARLEQASIEDLRRDDLLVAVVTVQVANEPDELIIDESATR